MTRKPSRENRWEMGEWTGALPDRVEARLQGRLARRTLTLPHARDAIGVVPVGGGCYGFTKGSWNLIDLVDHLVDQCPSPPAVSILMWSAAVAEIRLLWEWWQSGRLASCRWMLDRSIVGREPAMWGMLRALFPDVRLIRNHAKVVLLDAGDRAFTVLSSANLDENRRIEWWEITDDRDRLVLFAELFDLVWRAAPDVDEAATSAGAGRVLEALAEDDPDGAIAAEREAAVRRMLGDGVWDQDVRRAGISFGG